MLDGQFLSSHQTHAYYIMHIISLHHQHHHHHHQTTLLRATTFSGEAKRGGLRGLCSYALLKMVRFWPTPYKQTRRTTNSGL